MPTEYYFCRCKLLSSEIYAYKISFVIRTVAVVADLFFAEQSQGVWICHRCKQPCYWSGKRLICKYFHRNFHQSERIL